MRTDMLLASLLFLPGCLLGWDGYEKSDGEDLDTETQTDTDVPSEDTDGEDPVNNDTGTIDCTFLVTVWDIDRDDDETYPDTVEDEIEMDNELTATLADSSPEGEVAPDDELVIMHISFTVPHAECPTVTVEHFQFAVTGQDYQHVQWEEAIRESGVIFRNLSDNQLIATTADGVFYGDGSEDPDWFTWYSSLPQNFQVEPGTTKTITMAVNASGAQTGDVVYGRVSPDSIHYSVAGNAQVAELRHAAIGGHQLSIL